MSRTQSKKNIFSTGRRKTLSRLLAACIFVLFVATRDPFLLNAKLNITMGFVGLILVSIAAFGRLWSTLFIGGKKSRELIKSGPYSMSRHPLYLFSSMGMLGLGLASCNLVVLICLLLGFVIYYPGVMLTEEEKLYRKHGEDFTQYCSQVPRFLPNFLIFRQPENAWVSVTMFNKALLDNIWFILGFILIRSVVWLHYFELIPAYSLSLF